MPINQEIFSALLQGRQRQQERSVIEQEIMGNVAESVMKKQLTSSAEEAMTSEEGKQALLDAISKNRQQQQVQAQAQEAQSPAQQQTQQPLQQMDMGSLLSQVLAGQQQQPLTGRQRFAAAALSAIGADPTIVTGRANEQQSIGAIATLLNASVNAQRFAREEKTAREFERLGFTGTPAETMTGLKIAEATGDQELRRRIVAKFKKGSVGGVRGAIIPSVGEAATPEEIRSEQELVDSGALIGTKFDRLGNAKEYISTDSEIEKGKIEGIQKATGKDFESSQKLASATRRLSVILRQFNEALPAKDKTPLEQRISAFIAVPGAKTGIIPNEKLLALQKNIRPMAINLIRLFGEVGNLSESEQQGAIDTVNLAGLTEEERIASVKQFAEFALAGSSPEVINWLSKEKDITQIMGALDINLPQLQQQTNISDDQRELDAINKRLAELDAMGN